MNAFYDVMYGLDGTLSVCELAQRLGRPVREVRYWTDSFASKGLLTKEEFVLHRRGAGHRNSDSPGDGIPATILAPE